MICAWMGCGKEARWSPAVRVWPFLKNGKTFPPAIISYDRAGICDACSKEMDVYTFMDDKRALEIVEQIVVDHKKRIPDFGTMELFFTPYVVRH